MTGRMLSHYQVLEKLGEGGMGVVYKARDTRLDRFVAIKLLPPEAVIDSERKLRFIQEARSASALNHPNIVTIYDIGSDGGIDFIAMEFVDGPALVAILAERRPPLAETLDYAIQIADALARAHGAGIVHRDLKPGNVLVNRHGLVKVLDFGLAKLLDTTPSDTPDDTVAMSPKTEHGTLLGTTAYVSPEQAEGKAIDARSDIFSFGTLLYEMVSGRQAFAGDSKIATLAAILHKEPEPLKDVPIELAKIIARCLRKDVSWRFQHMADVRVALAEWKRESEVGMSSDSGAVAAVTRTKWLRWAIPAVVAALLLAGGAAGWRLWSSRTATPLPALLRLTSDEGLNTDPALSADGKLVAYASDRASDGNLDIWVQDTIGGNTARLTNDPADDHSPAFSPNGTTIAFRSERAGGGIYVIPTLGGEARLIAPGGREPRYSPDGNWIAYWTGQELNFGSRLYVMPAGGGPARQLQTGFPIVRSLIWAADGRHLIFHAYYHDQWDWYVTPMDGGTARATGALPLLASYRLERYFAGQTLLMPSLWDSHNDVIFSARVGDSTGLWRIGLDPDSGRVHGSPERLTLGSGEDLAASLSGNAHLAFSSQQFKVHLWMLPADTNTGKVTGPVRQLTDSRMIEFYPHSSDDGRKVVWATSAGRETDVRTKDVVTGQSSVLINSNAAQPAPKLSRDGSKVVYQVDESGKSALYSISSRSGLPERICAACGRPTHWSRDGRFVLFDSATAEPASAGVLEVSSGHTSPLLRGKASLYSPRFSSDDRWIAFHVLSSATTRTIFVAPFDGLSEIPENRWIAITDGKTADREPYWSPDGTLVYYLSERDGFRCIWAQRLEAATRQPVGGPFAVAHFHSARRSLTNVGYGTGLIGLSIAQDKIVFAQGELTGNLWMMELPARQ